MEKPYDLKELGKRLKDAGLVQAEESAEKALDVIAGWIIESAELSPNPLDNIAAIALPKVVEAAKGVIDKIDGQPG